MDKQKMRRFLDSYFMRGDSLLQWSGAMKWSQIFGDAIIYDNLQEMWQQSVAVSPPIKRVYVTSDGEDCTGLHQIQVNTKKGRDGVILEIPSAQDAVGNEVLPLFHACIRGRNYRTLTYHPDRLKVPMKRVGKRGDGNFKPISWAEAIQEIALKTEEIGQTYGGESRYVITGFGNSQSAISNQAMIQKLLALTGGYLNGHGNYRYRQTEVATTATYGSVESGNSYTTLKYSKIIILMGHNPRGSIFGRDLRDCLIEAKNAGAKIISVDPRFIETFVGIVDEWIPIRPTTDAALMDAMAYIILTRRLYDKDFLNRFCIGFDRVTLPKGVSAKESVKAYLLGKKDGIAKTPEWAEKITGIPENKIIELALCYARNKPSALILGYGGQRHINGEQQARGGILLACMTGNVGVRGGWASGMGAIPNSLRDFLSPFESVENPVRASIPSFLFTEAIVRGTEMTREEGLQGVKGLSSNIKAIYNFTGNAFINQHSDINRTKEILSDETQVEFIVSCDLFMTTSAKYADILLPGVSFLEKNDIFQSWAIDRCMMAQQKIIEPLYQARDEYDFFSELASKMGVYDAFTEGKTREEWIDCYIDKVREAVDSQFPDFQTLCEKGLYFLPEEKEYIAFSEQIHAPENHLFHTPSGRIELYLPHLLEGKAKAMISRIPKYIPACIALSRDQVFCQYPLQLIGFHCHSVHDYQPWLEETEQHVLWMHPINAADRGIVHGDWVRVYNNKGATKIRVMVTTDIMEGVVAMPVGSWHETDKTGLDLHGSINVLTTQHATKWAKGNPQHTIFVEIEKL